MLCVAKQCSFESLVFEVPAHSQSIRKEKERQRKSITSPLCRFGDTSFWTFPKLAVLKNPYIMMSRSLIFFSLPFGKRQGKPPKKRGFPMLAEPLKSLLKITRNSLKRRKARKSKKARKRRLVLLCLDTLAPESTCTTIATSELSPNLSFWKCILSGAPYPKGPNLWKYPSRLKCSFSLFPVLPFLVSFWRKARKTAAKTRIFYPYWTPKIPGKRKKRSKKQGIPCKDKKTRNSKKRKGQGSTTKSWINPHAHKNKIGTSTPPSKKIQTPPPP